MIATETQPILSYTYPAGTEIMIEGDEFSLRQGDRLAWYPVKSALGQSVAIISTEPKDVRRPIYAP